MRPSAISKTDIFTTDSGESNALLIRHSRPKRTTRISSAGGSTGWTIIPVPACSTDDSISMAITTERAFKLVTVACRAVYIVMTGITAIKYLWNTAIWVPGKCLQPVWVVCHSMSQKTACICELYLYWHGFSVENRTTMC